MTRQLGLGHFTMLDLPPADLVRTARAAGFGFVGLRFHPVAPGQVHWLPDAAGLRALRRVMEDEAIGLYDIETVVIDEALDPDSLVPAMEAAASLGGRRVNVCGDTFPGLADTFARLCELAGERGLGIDLECMAWRGLNTPAACLELIDATGVANAAYLVDSLHHCRCGGTPDDIANMRGRVVSAQISDAPLSPPLGRDALIAEARGGRLLPGEGGLPLGQIVAALPDTAVISVELPSTHDHRPPLERASAIHSATMFLLQDPAP